MYVVKVGDEYHNGCGGWTTRQDKAHRFTVRNGREWHVISAEHTASAYPGARIVRLRPRTETKPKMRSDK